MSHLQQHASAILHSHHRDGLTETGIAEHTHLHERAVRFRVGAIKIRPLGGERAGGKVAGVII